MGRMGRLPCRCDVAILFVDLFRSSSRCRQRGLFCAIRRQCPCGRMCAFSPRIVPSSPPPLFLLQWLFCCRQPFLLDGCSSWLTCPLPRCLECWRGLVPKRWQCLGCCRFCSWSGFWWSLRWLILALVLGIGWRPCWLRLDCLIAGGWCCRAVGFLGRVGCFTRGPGSPTFTRKNLINDF